MGFNNLQKETYQRAALLCSRSEKCSWKIEQKLLDWGLSPDEAKPVLKKLISEKFIDDNRFSRSYVRDKFRFNNWGKIKIAYLLRAEKIPGTIIDWAIAEIEDENYLEILTKLLQEKNKTVKAVNPYERRARLFRFAQGRGFEPELIHRVIGRIEKA